MTATFTWNIDQLDTYPLIVDRPNIVYTVYWTCTGDDTDINGNPYVATQTGYCNIPYDPSTYIPYASLTPDTILAWVWVYGSNKSIIESIVQDKLTVLMNPAVVTPLPWV